jgi:hypothetical protein
MIRLSRLEIQVANACNLTCESCSHFSNSGHRGILSMAEAETWMEAWRRRLLPGDFCLLGGEPTINPRLNELVYLAKEKWPYSRLRLITNGFFLHKHPNLPAALSETGAILCLTIHHRSPEYLQHVAGISKLLNEWRVNFPFRIYVEDSRRRWTRRYRGFGPDVTPFDDHTPRASWEKCACRYARQLFRGKLWKCSTIAYLQLQKEAYPEISPEWDPYLAYEPLDPSCSDAELVAFLRREDEEICHMCPASPERFTKESPLIPVHQLLKNVAKEHRKNPGQGSLVPADSWREIEN